VYLTLRSPLWGVARKLALATVLVAAVTSSPCWSKGEANTGTGSIRLTDLPAQAQQTDRLIRNGGPFPFSKDGIVFGNRERVLPRRARGFYREYTVRTPGAGNRGARRIVCGGDQPKDPEACYYTDDHYASFRKIVQ
jgi:ribonuclease T1